MQLQAAPDAVRVKLANVGLQLSGTEMEAMLVHWDTQACCRVTRLQIDSEPLGWKTRVHYLGLMLNHRDDFRQVTKQLRARAGMASLAVRKGAPKTAAAPNRQPLAVGLLMHALPLVALWQPNLRQLEGDHLKGTCACLGLLWSSQCHKPLARAGVWMLRMAAEQQALGHVDWLQRAEGGGLLCSSCTSTSTRSLLHHTTSIKD